MTELNVYYGERLAGYLTKDSTETEQQFSFRYDPQYLSTRDARAVSVNLPLTKEVYRSKILFPFFDNLLAEGWLLNQQLAEYKIDKSDRFALIEHCGLETMGSVSLRGRSNE